jgi:DNA gyrase subunit A
MTDTPDLPDITANGDGADGAAANGLGGNVEPIEIQEEMERSFLDYAMSVIVSRALPDARDGLKPVHRRILWDMEVQGFRPDRPHVKCARVSGDTMAKFHPHGDGAIYDALVRMAQPFSLRHPLIDFHGNYGSPDFGPAASRYTECRLDPLAMQLLAGIDENTVDFSATYDGSSTEPVVLPSRFPNLLVNGSQGIAVGMATNIPPHNLGEVIDATVHLVHNPEATPDDLMQFVKGPDFPTGGLILGRSGIIEAYRTGRGSVKMRASASIEEVGKRGDRFQIVVTQMPYQVSVTSVVDRVKDLVASGDLVGIDDINDETSQKTGTRLVIPLKKDANANVVLNNLFKLTQLQTSFAVNTVALVNGVPRTLNLVQALQAYIDHQLEVITRRSEHRLDKRRRRAHIVEGLIRALNVIDEIIALIRASDDRPAALAGLMTEPFSFSEEQANHILDMRLGQLTRLSRIDLESELATLRSEIAELEAILADEARKRAVIIEELLDIRAKHATPRRAILTHDSGDIDDLELIDDKELVVVMTKAGYLKTVDATSFRTQKRGGVGVAGARLRTDDLVSHVIFTTAHAYLLLFSNRGRVYRLRAHEIPERERNAKGLPVVNLLPLAPDETIQAIIDTREYGTERYLFFVTRLGQVKKTTFSEYDSSRRDGLIALNLREGDELVRVVVTDGHDDLILVSRMGMSIRFSEEDVRPMGRAAAGVRGMKLRAGDMVVSADVVRPDAALLLVTDNGYGKRTQTDRFNAQGRGGQGVIGIKLTARKGGVAGAFLVGLDDEIVMVATTGQTIRMPVRDISSQGREATGVRLMSLDDGTVASVAPILASVED